MNSLKIINYSAFAICRFRDNMIYPSRTPQFSYTFKPGAYALIGQIDNGGWAFAYSLAAKSKKDLVIEDSATFAVNGQSASLDQVRSLAHYVGHYKTRETRFRHLTAKSMLEKAMRKGQPAFSMEQLKEMLGITEERYRRPLPYTGNEAWRITAAEGLALGKQIFCYPWMSNQYFKSYAYLSERLADICVQNNCILLMPLENEKAVKHFVNDVIDLSKPQIFK